MTIQGIGGTIITDEFYFEDEDELDALFENDDVEEEETSLAQSSALVIKDFVQAFMHGEERINAPIYLEQVNAAVMELSTIAERQEIQLKDMGNSAIAIFEQINVLVNRMKEQQADLTTKLETLLNDQEENNSPRGRFGGGGVMFFPTFKYMGTIKVLSVRELSPCRYLTSFMLAYHHHLTYVQNKRAKLIFVHQKGEGVARKYQSFTSITQESMQNEALYASPIIATNNPKNEVMRKLTKTDDNVIIVVDRLYGNQPIISGKTVNIFAVGGLSDLDRFNVKPKNCIFSMAKHPDGLFALSHLKTYPRDADSRYAVYNSAFEKNFEILDNLLELNGK